MSVLLHENFWFVDTSTTSSATTYDFQGASFLHDKYVYYN